MPVRSLSSPVLIWPRANEVDRAVRRWAAAIVQKNLEVIRIGYFGSYARGDFGVGSDLDVIAIVKESQQAFQRRSVSWDVTKLPVPAEVLVYTKDEWERLKGSRFHKTVQSEVIWVYAKSEQNDGLQ